MKNGSKGRRRKQATNEYGKRWKAARPKAESIRQGRLMKHEEQGPDEDGF
jgi:hypothetical protein